MLILRELGKKYLAARFAVAYYTAAFQKILQEAAQGSFRIMHPPGTALSQHLPENFQMELATGDATWGLQWASSITPENRVDTSADWLSPDLIFPDPDFFWDSNLQGNFEPDFVPDL